MNDIKAIYKFFKAYDLRGTYPILNASVYYWMGYGVVNEVFKREGIQPKLLIFHDHRYTSEEFYHAFCSGVVAGGGEIIPLGLGTTDLMYASSQLHNLPGAMITASHNPKDDNGCKIVKRAPEMLGLSGGLDKVRDFVIDKLSNNPDFNLTDKLLDKSQIQDNTKIKNDVISFYKTKLELIATVTEVKDSLLRDNTKLRIVVDCGNGMGGYMMKIMQEVYGQSIEFIPLYWELDGTYPNHPADPSDLANVADLMQRVVLERADLGVAFDGDADRAYFVDENGEFMNGNFVVSAFATQFLTELKKDPNPRFNPTVAYSQPQSRCTPLAILDCDGIPVPSKQGHISIKANMLKYNSIYGGESSGHHYFGDFNYMDAGAISMAKMIQIITLQKVKPSSLVSKYKARYFLSGEENFMLPASMNFEIIKNLLYKHFEDATFSELDGLSVIYPDWKLNVRMSNTEPLLRINIECIGVDLVKEKLEEVKNLIGI